MGGSAHSRLFGLLSKFCHDYPMLEDFCFIAGASLADPQVMFPIAKDKKVVKVCFGLQVFHAGTQFRFVD